MTLEIVDENKTDGCQRCITVETALTAPIEVMAESDDDITLAYRCVTGHEWETSWAKGFTYAR